MNYKEDVKRKILNDVLKLKKKKVPEEVIFTDIRGILKKYNLNASDENVLDIYKDCEAYIGINNLFHIYHQKSFDGLKKNEVEETIQYAQIYLSKKKCSDVSKSEAKEIMQERDIAEELAKKYLYNPDGTKKVENSLVEDKLFTIYLRTGQFDILEKESKQLLKYNEKDKKIENPDLRTASKYIKMLVLQGKNDEAVSFIKSNKKMFETCAVIMKQLYNIYDLSNNTEGCLNVIHDAKKIHVRDYEPNDLAFMKRLHERGIEEIKNIKSIPRRFRLNEDITAISNCIDEAEKRKEEYNK